MLCTESMWIFLYSTFFILLLHDLSYEVPCLAFTEERIQQLRSDLCFIHSGNFPENGLKVDTQKTFVPMNRNNEIIINSKMVFICSKYRLKIKLNSCGL